VPPGQFNTKGGSGGGSEPTTSTVESFQYYFHPDHLGSSSYITDASGEVYQHLEYFAFGETFVEEHSNTNRTPYLYNGKELDDETGLYYYGARYYDARASIWVSVDPKAADYPSYSPYAFNFGNPINFVDVDGREGVPVFMSKGGYTYWPKLRAHQWYTINAITDSRSFDRAAKYNTAHNNSSAYTNINERRNYYAWADKQISNKSRWFAAAEIVTRGNAVGAADGVNLWYLSDGAERFLQQGNRYLFSYNMSNFKNIQNGTLNGSFTDANGQNVSFKGLQGKALDYALVQFEQSKVQDFINQYQKNNPGASMDKIYESINDSMGSIFAPCEVKKVMNRYFNGGESFNFGSYNDRVKLGQKLVDQLY
jgi:RHS repeat-associated protein